MPRYIANVTETTTKQVRKVVYAGTEAEAVSALQRGEGVLSPEGLVTEIKEHTVRSIVEEV